MDRFKDRGVMFTVRDGVLLHVFSFVFRMDCLCGLSMWSVHPCVTWPED